ncbi:Uncharacterised protein [Vibrio cholerae]|uniref:Uncharacterized protein n=1 Tax=Vibrio cholerae TaxID=666 RepID=A0A655WAQ4_VIBCL|nr:Uncharacterised protein [Vibrio cholerae]
MRITRDAVIERRGKHLIGRLFSLTLRRLLLMQHANARPFVGPVTTAISHHSIKPLIVSARMLRRGNPRQDLFLLNWINALPNPL